MKIIDYLIKSLAVVVFISALSVSALRETLNDIQYSTGIDLLLVKSQISAKQNAASVPESILEKRQKEVVSRDFGNIPFLCKGIKYKCITKGETVVLYNSNQIIEYNILYGICIKYQYMCSVGEGKYSIDVLMNKAQKDVEDAVLNNTDADIINIEILDKNPKTVTFGVEVNTVRDSEIIITYRRDTGSCIFFDAESVVRALVQK